MLRRLWTFLFGPRETPHRWICTECKRTWDTGETLGGSVKDPSDMFRAHMYVRHLIDKHPWHQRETISAASDGPRATYPRCGPIAYEGRVVAYPPIPRPMPPAPTPPAPPDWLDAPEAIVTVPRKPPPSAGHAGCDTEDCSACLAERQRGAS